MAEKYTEVKRVIEAEKEQSKLKQVFDEKNKQYTNKKDIYIVDYNNIDCGNITYNILKNVKNIES